jgi:hypothetical protein
MNTTIATHQPNYIPWIGFFYKIYRVNVFVFLDDVQFSKKGAHNYHYLKTPEGSVKIKIPVKHSYHDPINKVKTNDKGGWKERHLKLLEKNYSEAKYFKQVYKDFESLITPEYNNLAEQNIEIVKFICSKFNFKTKFVKSSELEITSKSEQRIIDICKKLDGEVYYSGRGAKAYQNEENFLSQGVELVYDDFEPIEYIQLNPGFQANVSILDYLMNHGYDWEGYINN